MGTLEDIRKVMQDFLAPELRALSEKVDAVDRRLTAFEKNVDERFKAAEKNVDERFKTLEKNADERSNAFEKHVDERFKAAENLSKEQYLTMMQMLDINRRMAKLEDRAEKPN